MVARGADDNRGPEGRKERRFSSVRHHGRDVQDRLLTALGVLAAVAAVVAGFALLFSVLDEGGSDPAAPATTVVRIRVPGGKTADGRQAKPGHASVGTKAPEVPASPEGPSEAEGAP